MTHYLPRPFFHFLLFLLVSNKVCGQDTIKIKGAPGSLQLSEENYNKGISALQAGEYREAVALSTDRLANHRAFIKALSRRALSYASNQHFDSALTDTTTVIQQKPNKADTYFNESFVVCRMNRSD